MNRMTLKARVGKDGILQVTLPVGVADANREVQVTVEPTSTPEVSQDDWHAWLNSTAGAWQGEFERPEQGELETRDPL
jgi:hypothetical protein